MGGSMKEVKIRLDDAQYDELIRAAKRSLRSVTKQVTIYIIHGLKAEEPQAAVVETK